jgi:hypothetical protein
MFSPDMSASHRAPAATVRSLRRGRKMRVYARERVGHLWIVDPILRTVALEMRRWWREQ